MRRNSWTYDMDVAFIKRAAVGATRDELHAFMCKTFKDHSILKTAITNKLVGHVRAGHAVCTNFVWVVDPAAEKRMRVKRISPWNDDVVAFMDEHFADNMCPADMLDVLRAKFPHFAGVTEYAVRAKGDRLRQCGAWPADRYWAPPKSNDGPVTFENLDAKYRRMVLLFVDGKTRLQVSQAVGCSKRHAADVLYTCARKLGFSTIEALAARWQKDGIGGRVEDCLAAPVVAAPALPAHVVAYTTLAGAVVSLPRLKWLEVRV